MRKRTYYIQVEEVNSRQTIRSMVKRPRGNQTEIYILKLRVVGEEMKKLLAEIKRKWRKL